MQPIQLDRLRQHGLSVTPGRLQGFPVLLLALVSTNTAALSCALAPAHAVAGAATKATRPHPAANLKARQPCHIKRPPHRPFRS
ncbi:MAG: hypothetical protein RL462_461 [Pseudomonadota bacterium]|jgi:hypothetical protein